MYVGLPINGDLQPLQISLLFRVLILLNVYMYMYSVYFM